MLFIAWTAGVLYLGAHFNKPILNIRGDVSRAVTAAISAFRN